MGSANPVENGHTLVFTPENSLNFWTTCTLPMGLEFGLGGQFVDAVLRNTTSTTEVPSYWLFDAKITYPLNETITLQLNASNLADGEYIDRVGGGHFVPGRRVSLTASFGL